MTMLEYLLSLDKEQLAEAIKALPQAERKNLIHSACAKVDTIVASVVQNADEIWENR